MHFTKKQNNVQPFVNLHICPIIILCRQLSPRSLCSILFSRKNHRRKSQ